MDTLDGPSVRSDDGAIDRRRRSELLAIAEARSLLDLADACLEGTDVPELIAGPDVGMVVMTVREPVEATRFHLGEVLVTRAEVEHRGQRGWSMRMGDDRAGALRADLALIDDRGRWPSVIGVHRAGDHPERRALS